MPCAIAVTLSRIGSAPPPNVSTATPALATTTLSFSSAVPGPPGEVHAVAPPDQLCALDYIPGGHLDGSGRVTDRPRGLIDLEIPKRAAQSESRAVAARKADRLLDHRSRRVARGACERHAGGGTTSDNVCTDPS